MAESPSGRVALMAMHPRYADAILDGRKRVEFRKRRVASDIDTVLIYATSPVSRIVGTFTIEDVHVDEPASIWEKFGEAGVIEYDAYSEYYATSVAAVAICVKHSERFESPLELSELDPSPAVPQSFSYLPDSVLS